MVKEYVKLTTDQFRELIQMLPDLLAMLREMNDRLSTHQPPSLTVSCLAITASTATFTNYPLLNT